jgi:hypothetical protein
MKKENIEATYSCIYLTVIESFNRQEPYYIWKRQNIHTKRSAINRSLNFYMLATKVESSFVHPVSKVFDIF